MENVADGLDASIASLKESEGDICLENPKLHMRQGPFLKFGPERAA